MRKSRGFTQYCYQKLKLTSSIKSEENLISSIKYSMIYYKSDYHHTSYPIEQTFEFDFCHVGAFLLCECVFVCVFFSLGNNFSADVFLKILREMIFYRYDKIKNDNNVQFEVNFLFTHIKLLFWYQVKENSMTSICKIYNIEQT